MADIDYESIAVPDDKPRSEYHYTTRRAEILELVREAGHPRAFSQRALADKFGVSVGTINSDMQALAEYIDDALGDNRAFVSELVFQRAIQELLDDREWRKAAKTTAEWNEFVWNYKEREEFEERLDAVEELNEELQDDDSGYNY